MSGTAAPELTAICHLLPMDTGLFCVSLTEPAQPAPSRAHFPGVRLSLPPGPQSEHRGVTICTFRPDGWLDMERPAALVHVTDGPAHVMLTIYHEASQPRDAAPCVVITQLAQMVPARGPGSAPTAVAQPSASPFASAAAPSGSFVTAPISRVVTGYPSDPGVVRAQAGSQSAIAQGTGTLPATPLTEGQIVAHIRNRGDVQARLTDWIGLPGSRLWIEGFGMTLPAGWVRDSVEYQGLIAKTGATPWLSGPDFCGSRGQTLPLLGVAVRLTGTAARLYDCSYRASFIDGTSAGPVQQGQLCQSFSQAALEAFQVTIVRR